MTVNYFIKCPVCGAVTRMRSPAGYTYETPVHIHCGRCETLLTGKFISDNDKVKTYYIPVNCEEVGEGDYDYYGEASGEILCEKIEHMPGNTRSSFQPLWPPAFELMMNMDQKVLDRYIDFVCHMEEVAREWDSQRILYDLYLRGKYDLIREKYASIAQKQGYLLDEQYNIHRYVYYTYIYHLGGLFTEKQLKDLLCRINDEVNHLNNIKLDKLLIKLQATNQIATMRKRLFKIMYDYIGVAKNLMPALGATFYNKPENIDKVHRGITTCTFEEIKSFYQDTYESLAGSCVLVAWLDNIKYRDDYDIFLKGRTTDDFQALRKGERIKALDSEETFSCLFGLDGQANQLRNAIGHNDYSYNVLEQTITYVPNAKCPEKVNVSYLLDIAMSCIALARSAFTLNILLFKLTQQTLRSGEESLIMHPIFYSQARSGSHCPCGSGKKYRNCCKSMIESEKRNKEKSFELPHKSGTTMDAKARFGGR